eukprot:Lithocolla_globosa_v1_NODE_2520_length_1965_cov_146.627225.p1 type:complete len:208 gc:universal NODE_2520_length_1965_cov_146.627225:1593-970(-)
MVRELFFRLLLLLKKNTKCKFIIAGDWGQLEVVMDRADFDYENSHAIHDICDGVMVQLTECRRADTKLFELYNNPEDVNTKDFGKMICKKSLAYHNSKRKEINNIWMKRLKSNNYMTIEKNKMDKYIDVYKNLPIMSCKTNNSLDIVNGEEFYVTDYDHDNITITDNDRTIDVKKDIFQKIFYPSYCITVHRSHFCEVSRSRGETKG